MKFKLCRNILRFSFYLTVYFIRLLAAFEAVVTHIHAFQTQFGRFFPVALGIGTIELCQLFKYDLLWFICASEFKLVFENYGHKSTFSWSVEIFSGACFFQMRRSSKFVWFFSISKSIEQILVCVIKIKL